MPYGVGYAVLSCLVTHVLLHHTKDIINTFKGEQKKDIHARLLLVVVWNHDGKVNLGPPIYRHAN